jgi:acyl-coenzyme A thioesterase PaaI-like protein
MLSPAIGDRLIARGLVLKPGSKLTVAEAKVFVVSGSEEKLVATALGTLVAI